MRKTMLSLAHRFEHAEHAIHVVVLVVALVLGLMPAITAAVDFEPTRIHLDWKTFVGLAIVTVDGALILIVKASLWSAGSAVLGPASQAAKADDAAIERVDAGSIKDLAAYVDSCHPPQYVSNIDKMARTEMYSRWAAVDPNFAMCARAKTNGRIVGVCIMVPLKHDTFAAYRNGTGGPASWLESNLGPDADLSVLFIPAHHVVRGMDQAKATWLLTELFQAAAALHVHDISKTIFVAPVKTPTGRANVRAMGFEQFRKSATGFEIWELDGRRLSEMSKPGQSTLRAVTPSAAQNVATATKPVVSAK